MLTLQNGLHKKNLSYQKQVINEPIKKIKKQYQDTGIFLTKQAVVHTSNPWSKSILHSAF